MTPTRIQLHTQLHGIVGGPRALLTLDKGDSFKRAALQGVDGWLITDVRGKSIWVPLDAVAGVDVDLAPEQPFVVREEPMGDAKLAWIPTEPVEHVCPFCGKSCKTGTALAGHVRFKHPAPEMTP